MELTPALAYFLHLLRQHIPREIWLEIAAQLEAR